MAAHFCAAFLLAGCATDAPVSRTAGKVDGTLTRFPVLDNAVVIAAPAGYCIDAPGSRSDSHDAFVLLASCRAVTGREDAPTPRRPGLLTASVDGTTVGRAFPSEQEFAAFFDTTRGEALLSSTGNSDHIAIREHFAKDGAYFVHALERNDSDVLDGQSWRTIFEVNGRMVTATLRDVPDHPIPSQAGMRIVEDFASRIAAASPRMR
ncbi:hypothetical protein CLV78_10319 [Aliiruegeria haliotis]|uniref:Uncharacterized protein n=2 Tax=Aliiruegeria haliotis TaxID=1280846 RepID=A0A2T0RSI0_9RHOB|nr:hypothetical protein CLV78_10319 [Aliiruegeria haliotis]